MSQKQRFCPRNKRLFYNKKFWHTHKKNYVTKTKSLWQNTNRKIFKGAEQNTVRY